MLKNKCGQSFSAYLILGYMFACADPEGGGTLGPYPPEKSQNIGFLRNSSPDPLKNHKTTKSAFNVGPTSARQLNAI